MFESEGVKQRLEDGELGLEGGHVRRAQVGAMCGVRLGGLGTVREGTEANSATRGHLVSSSIWLLLLLLMSGISPANYVFYLGRRRDV